MLPSVITEIAYNSRRYSGFKLCLRCVLHLVDPKHAGIRISNIEVIEITHQNTKKIALVWSCKVPASMENVFHNVKVCMTFDDDMHCIDCDCTAGRDNK